MRAEIISVGTELLLGDIVNTNAQYIAQELAALGFTVYNQSVVGDNPARLKNLIQTAKERTELIIFTGGLGPTADDLTKEAVAEMYGDSLVMDDDELAKIESFFTKRGLNMTENNRKQAMVPKKGSKILNKNGTAPGAFFRQGNRYAILLPGPPQEMRPMFDEQVRPLLEAMQDSSIRSYTLNIFGMGESELETKVFDLLNNDNPTAALYAKTGEVQIRITARASTAEQADMMCKEYAMLFRKILGDIIYSESGENLQETVVRLLKANGETLATAESCTGGLLSERITSVSGASEVFSFGVTTYANEVKHELLGVRQSSLRNKGAVSSEVAAQMAFGALDKGVANYGIGITGVAGPSGGSKEKPVGLVYVALAKERTVYVKKFDFSGRGRENVRWMATQNALDMVRRLACEMPINKAKEFNKNQQADFEREGKPRAHRGALKRILIAVLAVVIILAGVMVGNYFGQKNAPVVRAGAPSTKGLQYGTKEYTAAACKLVEQEAEQNPAVVGFVAMPGAIEQLVGKSSFAQNLLKNPDTQAGMNGMLALPQDAKTAGAFSNTVLLGGSGVAGVHAFQNTGKASEISTFTYYTKRDAREYKIFSVMLLDEDEVQRDGFKLDVEKLDKYQDFTTFVLGAKVRSMYEISLDLKQSDSYMTISATDPKTSGRKFLVVGRMIRGDEEKIYSSPAMQAGAVLMPAAFYTQTKTKAPDINEIWKYWLRWFLLKDVTTADLQLQEGMPKEDRVPLIAAPRPLAPSQTEEASAVQSSDVSSGLQKSPSSQSPSSQSSSSQSSSSQSSSSQSLSSQSSSLQSSSLQSSSSQSLSSQSLSSQSLSSQVISTVAANLAKKPVIRLLAASNPENPENQTASSATSAPTSSQSSSSSSSSSSLQAVQSSSQSVVLQSLPLQLYSKAVSSSQSDSEVSSEIEEPLPQSKAKRPPRPAAKKSDPSELSVNMNGQIITAKTKDVLAWVCQKECGWMKPEAIKAQAIAAHSWILNQQGAGNVTPKVLGALPSEKVLEAVGEVDNLVLTHINNTPAFTPFYNMAAQGTNTSEEAFGSARAYLTSVPSVQEQRRDDWRKIENISRDTVVEIIKENSNINLTAIEDPNEWFEIIEMNDGGYVTSIKVGNETFGGMEFWQNVFVKNGRKLLKSPAFEISYNGEEFTISTYGEGHGCGMSQFAMGVRADEGWDYERILSHYYKGTKLIEWT